MAAVRIGARRTQHCASDDDEGGDKTAAAARVRRIVIHFVVVRLERDVVLIIRVGPVACLQPIAILLRVVDPVVVVPVLIVGCERRLVMAARRGERGVLFARLIRLLVR
jgi:hypothetical protein